MLSADDTDHLLLLPVAIAVALAVLAAPISEASPTPQSQIPGFLLDRGRYTTIEIQGARVETAPLGINDRGDIAGAYDDGKGDHGFMRDRRGRITTIDVPGARGTAAQKINNRGQIAGVYSDTTPDTQVPPTRGFLLDRGNSPGSMSLVPCKPGPSASTTAGRWWASTLTLPGWFTASCGTRGSSRPSTSPARPGHRPSTSTIAARSSARRS
jgi:hypothetical protein